MVSVGDRRVPLHEAAELVEEMTDDQRDAYNKIFQSVYADMYDWQVYVYIYYICINMYIYVYIYVYIYMYWYLYGNTQE